ncbi:hypothetical protein T265_14799, partial [Opisthorchis viverrini]
MAPPFPVDTKFNWKELHNPGLSGLGSWNLCSQWQGPLVVTDRRGNVHAIQDGRRLKRAIGAQLRRWHDTVVERLKIPPSRADPTERPVMFSSSSQFFMHKHGCSCAKITVLFEDSGLDQDDYIRVVTKFSINKCWRDPCKLAKKLPFTATMEFVPFSEKHQYITDGLEIDLNHHEELWVSGQAAGDTKQSLNNSCLYLGRGKSIEVCLYLERGKCFNRSANLRPHEKYERHTCELCRIFSIKDQLPQACEEGGQTGDFLQ